MQNLCEQCIHQNQSWYEEPCYKCGSENDYAYCEDEHGNLIRLSLQKEAFSEGRKVKSMHGF